MIAAIFSFLAGIAKAIPSLFKWKLHNEKKKAKKKLEADLKKIGENIRKGDADAVAADIKRMLGK